MIFGSNGRKQQAHIAGVLFLLWILTGLFNLMYLPARIDRTGDAATAAANILANEGWFRAGILIDSLSGVLWMLLVLAFYRLFKPVSERWARLLVAWVVVQLPVVIVTQALSISSLKILKGSWLPSFAPGQQQELALLLLKITDQATVALQAYWGLWLLPLAVLVYRSRFLPRWLGIWLAINGAAYIVLCLTAIAAPQHSTTVYTATFPAFFGEMALMFWLLIMGAREDEAAVVVG